MRVRVCVRCIFFHFIPNYVSVTQWTILKYILEVTTVTAEIDISESGFCIDMESFRITARSWRVTRSKARLDCHYLRIRTSRSCDPPLTVSLRSIIPTLNPLAANSCQCNFFLSRPISKRGSADPILLLFDNFFSCENT